jgi:site-specific recombinase XerD
VNSRRTFLKDLSFKTESDGEKSFIFCGKKGNKPISRIAAWKIIKRAARRAKINAGVSPHWLCHSHATIVLESWADLRIIQSTLGHESVASTVKYTKVRLGNSISKFL